VHLGASRHDKLHVYCMLEQHYGSSITRRDTPVLQLLHSQRENVAKVTCVSHCRTLPASQPLRKDAVLWEIHKQVMRNIVENPRKMPSLVSG
jgi:hypothetical protein